MLVPYRVDVPMARWPWMNWAIIAGMVLAFVAESADPGAVRPLILNEDRPLSLVGYMWLHGGWLHLVGNMVFLWVFGNAVCAKIGNLPYLGAFLGLGILAGAAHLMFDGGPAVGASGAINGIVGMYLLLYPLNDISCLFVFIILPKAFTVSSIWMILFWLAFDVLGAMLGSEGVAYWAHLGGFAAGAAVMYVLLRHRVIRSEPYERTLLQVLGMERA